MILQFILSLFFLIFYICKIKSIDEMSHNIKSGVATGSDSSRNICLRQRKRFRIACCKCFFNKHGKWVMETAAKLNAPVIIQFSIGGSQFFAGKSLDNRKHQAAILGALQVHVMYTDWLRLMGQL